MMEDLQTQLENKAKDELRSLYYRKVEAFLTDFEETFHISRRLFTDTSFLKPLYDLRYDTSIEVMQDLEESYITWYIAEFIAKVGEV